MKKNIFKYYCVNDYSISALKSNQIFCNHYAAFNDPFECWSIEQSGIPHPVREKERYAAVYRAWGFDEADYSEDGIEQLIGYCEQFDNDYNRVTTRYTESARISCFSREIDNLLMWSHYTNGLRGFCVEFNPDELLKIQQAIILNVRYKRKPEYLDTMVFAVAEDQVDYHEMVIGEEYDNRKRLDNHKRENIRPYSNWLKKSRSLLMNLYSKQLAVKPLEWSYEKETRLIFHSENESSAGELFNYPASAVKSIVFGEKMPEKNQMLLKEIVQKKYPDVPIGKAIRNTIDYKINIQYEPQYEIIF